MGHVDDGCKIEAFRVHCFANLDSMTTTTERPLRTVRRTTKTSPEIVLYTFMGYCRIVYDGMGKKETKEKLTRVEGVIRRTFFSPILLFYCATLYIIYTCLHNNQTHPPSDVKYLITPSLPILHSKFKVVLRFDAIKEVLIRLRINQINTCWNLLFLELN